MIETPDQVEVHVPRFGDFDFTETRTKWDEGAACRQPQYRNHTDYWVPIEDYPSKLAKVKLKTGQMICNEHCPIKDLCKANAHPDDFKFTVRAGEWPTMIQGRGRGRPFTLGHEPSGAAAAGQRVDGICRWGHDTKVLGLVGKGQRCAQCHRDRNARHRRKKKLATMAG